ncbi:hypothetical protein [Streptomyces phaeochromogenes]|uniref:hypothetical protein n=1 Tax=Streptomyces phaeochromogenes TaxID=1923 RepID=UPI0012FED1B8|nr:hypothetical protein [Streptomyces phaeochromogenes]
MTRISVRPLTGLKMGSKANGNLSGGGTAPVLTGPAFIAKDNVAAVPGFAGFAGFAAKGTR